MPTRLEILKDAIAGKLPAGAPFRYPPPVAATVGFELVAVEPGHATMSLKTSTDRHANPMGTVHGGILCDLADAAIGTAHFATLEDGESFTSIDLKINFFRPVWNATLKAVAKPIQSGRNVSYYECSVMDEKGRQVALVTSTVMTLRGEAAKGR